MNDIKADIEGDGRVTRHDVKNPLTYGAGAIWAIEPASEVTEEQKAAYIEKIFNAIRAISDDGEVHGSKTGGNFDTILSLEEAVDQWVWGYVYNGYYVDAYCIAYSTKLSLELVYAGSMN